MNLRESRQVVLICFRKHIAVSKSPLGEIGGTIHLGERLTYAYTVCLTFLSCRHSEEALHGVRCTICKTSQARYHHCKKIKRSSHQSFVLKCACTVLWSEMSCERAESIPKTWLIDCVRHRNNSQKQRYIRKQGLPLKGVHAPSGLHEGDQGVTCLSGRFWYALAPAL